MPTSDDDCWAGWSRGMTGMENGEDDIFARDTGLTRILIASLMSLGTCWQVWHDEQSKDSTAAR